MPDFSIIRSLRLNRIADHAVGAHTGARPHHRLNPVITILLGTPGVSPNSLRRNALPDKPYAKAIRNYVSIRDESAWKYAGQCSDELTTQQKSVISAFQRAKISARAAPALASRPQC